MTFSCISYWQAGLSIVQGCNIIPSLISSIRESWDSGLYFAPQLPRGFDHFYGAGRGGEPPPPHSAGRGGEPHPPRGAERPSLVIVMMMMMVMILSRPPLIITIFGVALTSHTQCTILDNLFLVATARISYQRIRARSILWLSNLHKSCFEQLIWGNKCNTYFLFTSSK